MLTATQRTRLGVFMVVGAMLLCIFAAVPISFKVSNRTKTFYSYFEGERSLSGLEEGADVKYRGVRIGKINRISYDADNIERIRVEFRIKYDFPMKEGMFVETGFLGITGLRYVEVLGGANGAPLLKPGAELPSKPSLMASITGKTDVILEKIELLLNNITNFTHPDSLASVKEIFDNVASITHEVDGFVKDMGPDINKIAGSTRNTMQKVDLIASDVKSITSNINQAVNPEQLSQILTSIDSTARVMKTLSQNLDLTIRQTREDFTVSMENLRETLENANELSKILAENPSLLIRGETQKERDIR